MGTGTRRVDSMASSSLCSFPSFIIPFLVVVAVGCSDSSDNPTTPDTQVATLYPVRDNTLFEDPEGDLSNGSGTVLFFGNSGGSIAHRAVLAFDVAADIPAGSKIVRAEFAFNVSNAPDSIPRIVTLHRVLVEWGEGSSVGTGGGGAPADTNDATWLHRFYPDSPWSTKGGDFDVVATDSLMVAYKQPYAVSSNLIAADVQSWLDDPASNFGWLLMGDESLPKTARKLDSREHPTVANRPKLIVEFR